MNRNSPALPLLALLLAILAGGLLWYLGSTRFVTSGGTNTASVGGAFTLIDQNGARRSDKDFHGRWVLLYFGYSYCPDVCPTTLGVMADALSKLGPKESRIVPVFISIDPERDTPVALKKYLTAFGPEFVGLTGSLPEITAVAHEYRVYFAKHPLEGGGYAVDHSSVVYLLDPRGRFVKFYDDTTKPADLARDLSARL
jgi:protein SCO1